MDYRARIIGPGTLRLLANNLPDFEEGETVFVSIERGLFPAPAGMNRTSSPAKGLRKPVPRTRGDEPVQGVMTLGSPICSPHPRG